MNAKIKAKELVNKFYPIVNGYVGSSMLTNTEYLETILNNAKNCALFTVDEIRVENKSLYEDFEIEEGKEIYWNEVINEIQSLTVDSFDFR